MLLDDFFVHREHAQADLLAGLFEVRGAFDSRREEHLLPVAGIDVFVAEAQGFQYDEGGFQRTRRRDGCLKPEVISLYGGPTPL